MSRIDYGLIKEIYYFHLKYGYSIKSMYIRFGLQNKGTIILPPRDLFNDDVRLKDYLNE